MSIPATARRRHPGLLLGVLIVIFIAVPIFEVWLLIQFGTAIGVLPTVGILVAEAILGGWLMRREGSRAWAALNTAYGSGRMPTAELANAALVLVGGVMLMFPGFLTDLVGLFCLLPFTRPLARKVLAFVVARRIQGMGVDVGVVRAKMQRDDLIPGETVDNPAPDRRPPSDPRVIRGEVED